MNVGPYQILAMTAVMIFFNLKRLTKWTKQSRVRR